MKKCPFCAEMIPEDAGICPVCHKDLSIDAKVPQAESPKVFGNYPVDPFSLIALAFSICGFLLICSTLYWMEYFPGDSIGTILTNFSTGLLFNPFILVGLIFTILALFRIKKGKFQGGKHLAVASLIIDAVFIFLVALYLILQVIGKNNGTLTDLLQNIQRFIVIVMGS